MTAAPVLPLLGRDALSLAVEEVAVEERPLRYELLTAAQLADLPVARPLVKGLINVGGFSSIVAPYSSFKSFIALDYSLCVAKGIDFHGHEVTQAPAFYWGGEGAGTLFSRVEAWRILNGLPDVGDVRFLTRSLKLNDKRDLADLRAALRNLPAAPGIVTIDTVARSFRGNENSAEDTGLYVEAVDCVREEFGAHVQIVHHTGWEGSRSRGSSNIPSSLDTELTLDRDGDRVTMTVTKQKDEVEGPPVTLEAIPVAGSLAFRRVVLTSSNLSDAERKALNSVPRDGTIKAVKWESESRVKHTTFYRAKERLESLGYVKRTRDGFALTDAGKAAP